jgi:RNA polymerase Rpb4
MIKLSLLNDKQKVKAIQYLSADFQPTSSQSEAGISKLIQDLAPYELTKAEKLQVVNLAPTEPVELYVACDS